MSRFGFCSTNVRCHLFQTFCTSYYGSPLWGLTGQPIKQLIVAWRKCIRKILKVDARTHSCYLPELINMPDIYTSPLCRFSSFIANCMNSSNSYIQFALKLSRYSSSYVATNIRTLLAYIGQDYSCMYDKAQLKKDILRKYKNNCNDMNIIYVLKELILIRDNVLTSPLTPREANLMLQQLCTM